MIKVKHIYIPKQETYINGAIGDGVTDDTVAIQKAANFNEGKTISENSPTSKNSVFIPDGTYIITGNGIKFNQGSDINFQSDNTVLKYTGNAQCILIDGVHRFTMNRGKIDMYQAGNDAIGFNMKGAWLWSIYDLLILLKANSNQTGVFLQSTTSGGQNWGNYGGNIKNIGIFGSGKYGIRALTNDPTGTVNGGIAVVTNLTIDGGWIVEPESPMYLEGLTVGKIHGICLALGINALTIKNCSDISLFLGESGPCTGYNIFLENSNKIHDFGSSTVNIGTLGYTNKPSLLSGVNNNVLTLCADIDGITYTQIKSNYNYANPFEILVKGGSPNVCKLVQYSEIDGTRFGTYSHDAVLQLKTNGDTNISYVREFADNITATAGGLTIGTVYRTGDILKIVH
jgi:Pectate lyase superfamily protein